MTFLLNKFREFKISLFLIIFLVTLESFYSYYLSFNVVYILLLIVLIFEAISKIEKVNQKTFKLPNIFFLFFFTIFFISIISFFYYQPSLEYKFFLKITYALIFIYCLAISISNENLKNILSLVLLIHSGLLIIQFISFYIFLVHFDFFNIFWGLEQKGAHLPFRLERDLSNFLDLKRFSGLFNEPGTYCNVIGILSCLLSNIKNLNKYNKISLYISSLSLLITFSTYGYLYFFLIFISYTFNLDIKFKFKNQKKFKIIYQKIIKRLIKISKIDYIIILLSILFLITLSVNYSFPYFKNRFFDLSHQSGLAIRLSAYFQYFNYLLNDFLFLIIGKGMINETYAYYETSITYDNTLLFYLLSRSGIVIILISFILSLYFLKFNISKLFTFAIIMSSKLSLFSPIILFGLYLLMVNLNEKK